MRTLLWGCLVFLLLCGSAVAQDTSLENSGRYGPGIKVFINHPVVNRDRHRRINRALMTKRHSEPTDSGVVISRKTGKWARVGRKFRAKFQAYVNDLESGGATIYFMGGIRRGRCSLRHEHPCGRALDVCQVARDVVARGQMWRGRRLPNCHLPSRSQMAEIARRHGLFEGGQWCHGDLGHAQVDVSAPGCRARYARK